MSTNALKLSLLPQSALLKTGDVDHADWNYKPVLGTISRARFRLIRQLIGSGRVERLLEIGYGSGVFMPELAKHADELYGIDIHDDHKKVEQNLAQFDVTAKLASGGAEQIAHPDAFFDTVVAVSALEFVADLDAVCSEVKRVLKTGGRFLIVTPGNSPLLDFGLKVLTGKSAKDDFADRRDAIIPTLSKHFDVRQEPTFPKYGSSLIKLYTALELTPKR